MVGICFTHFTECNCPPIYLCSTLQTANLRKSKQLRATFFHFSWFSTLRNCCKYLFINNYPCLQRACFSFQILGKNNSPFWWNKSAFCSTKMAFYFRETATYFLNLLLCFLQIAQKKGRNPKVSPLNEEILLICCLLNNQLLCVYWSSVYHSDVINATCKVLNR